MPFSWFRRKKQQTEERADESQQTGAYALDTPADTAPAAEPAAESEDQKPKRRRGNRGGRGRKRPGEKADAAQQPAAPAAAAEEKEERPASRRRQPQRRRQPPRRPPLPPAKRELLVSVGVSEQRVAVLENDQVAEVYLERPERRSIAGNIYKGKVDNVLPGMEAAFIEIGLEKNGFLYVDEIVGPELEGRRHGRKIQDLLSRGQEILVQAVKDPMKSKGARLTTEISLPGRFVVFVPYGEGVGVSRRLEDDERARLKDILKQLDLPKGGVIVRTAAEGASAEDVERDLVFLQRLWKTIEARAKTAKVPSLVYQEAELPLRVVRDLFTGDFEKAYVDHERAHKRILGYLKKTSPHMAERVVRYRDKESLFERFGVESEIQSTLSRRVDLPSGGYLVFDYAEAFTVIDVNTGRFVGSRAKGAADRLEDTITKNNLEAVKEVVRQLRLRDIGGIIVIDFIDMANPKNRQAVEEALKAELERDRTKTYVVEISPLGLVEMTRQNVTDGPREILTKRCPTCAGDGVVLSEASAAVATERRLAALARESRAQAYRVVLNARVAARLIGPGAERLLAIEEATKRRFVLEGREDVPFDHFEVLAQGKAAELEPERPVDEGAELHVKLVEVGLHDGTAAIAKLDGYSVCVGGAAKHVGRKVKVRIGRFLDGTAYATLVEPAEKVELPLTAEAEAEKPTRAPRRRAAAAQADEAEPAVEAAPAEEIAEVDAAVDDEPVDDETGSEEKPKRRSRRGTRGGRRRRKAGTSAAGNGDAADAEGEAEEPGAAAEHEPEPPAPAPEVAPGGGHGPRIHVPPPELGLGPDDEADGAEGDAGRAGAEEDGAEQPRKRRTRRGTRGGRNRRKRAPVAGAESEGDAVVEPVEA